LEAEGCASSEGDVLILDISTTGLLIKTSGPLNVGETIELDLPEAASVRMDVKWSSGQLYGCQFKNPVSAATVSAALLRAPAGPHPSTVLSRPQFTGVADAGQDIVEEEKLPFAVRMRWLAGLTIASWAVVISPVYVAWHLF